MKNTILKIFIVTLAFGSGTVAFAENSTSTAGDRPSQLELMKTKLAPKPVQIFKENIKEVRASTTSAIKVIREETKEEIKKIMSERSAELRELKAKFSSSTEARKDARKESFIRIAEQRIRKMFDKMQATIDRELSITAKIVTRIEKFKLAGGKTEESEKHVAEAKTHFSNAQTTLDSLRNASTTLVAIINPETATSTSPDFIKAKNIVSEVAKHLRLGHQSLVKAVVNLKGLSSVLRATTTPTTSSSTSQTN